MKEHPRAVPAQRLPPNDLTGFPKYWYSAGLKLWRAGQRDYRPWWYCGCGDCRFDLEPPHGTCYLGTDELVCIIESIGPHLRAGDPVASELLDERVLWSWLLPSDIAVANFVTGEAVAFGITNEICTMTPYAIPQEWARSLHRSGFEGIRYRTRFDTDPGVRGVAHFGRAGDAGQKDNEASQPVDESLRARLTLEYRLTIAPPPLLDELQRA